MKAAISFSILLCFLLLSNSCSKQKNDDKLPPATQAGANTFGCFIDGQVWIPTGGGAGSGINPTSGGFFRNVDNSINVYIRAYSEHESVQIFLKHATNVGVYYLNKNTDIMPGPIFPESYGAYIIDGQDNFVTDSLHTGIVNITYVDIVNGIVSGTFEMHLYRKNTSEIKNITQGRFDYKNH